MIDIDEAKQAFQNYLNTYKNKDKLGFKLKEVHTYHVVELSKLIAQKLNLTAEDIKLAELIALLHDIGRFAELELKDKFDNVKFDHAAYGVKMLFENNLIREFIKDDKYDNIIKKAINNHSRLYVEDGLDTRTLLHANIIRDADKLDNFRIARDDDIEAIFSECFSVQEKIANSSLTDKIYETVKQNKSVDLRDRITILDCYVCVLAFVFDLNFKESYKIVKENNYINVLIDKFNYTNHLTKIKMLDIKDIMNNYIEKRCK